MKTILAVDNDESFLEELSIALELYDYRVVTCPDPVDALNTARQTNPDCILFDLKMPGKHGFQLFEDLRQDPLLRKIPAIAMTGHYSEDYDMFMDIFGICRLLKKPFSPDDAISMIKSAIVPRSRVAQAFHSTR